MFGGKIPRPDPEVENRSSGSGPVISYTLSPEELERYRSSTPTTIIPARKPNENTIDLTRYQGKPKEGTDLSSKYPQITKEFLESEFAAGKSGGQVEREQNMAPGTISYYIRKFGVKSQFAKDLNADQQAEIDRLRDELDKAIGRANENSEVAERTQKELVKANDQKRQLEQAISELDGERNALLDEIKSANTANESLHNALTGLEKQLDLMKIERDALLSTIEKAVDSSRPVPVSNDQVNHPAHYTAGGIECIDAIEAATTGLSGGQAYNTGAALKYIWRWSRKNGVEDLQKARWYIDRLIGEFHEES